MSNKKQMATLEDLATVCSKYEYRCGVCPLGNLSSGVSCIGAIQRDPKFVSQKIYDVLSGAHTHQVPVCAECTYKTTTQVANNLEYRCVQCGNRVITGNVQVTSPTWCPKRSGF